jgi:hypothetical protein
MRGRLEPGLSRWLWLVKWLLAIPHYIVLAFLWLAFVLLTAFALVAILVTGRYPRGLFDFNAGVLRWTWRVAFYSYGALGTDRYPPFTLAEKPGDPATLEIAYPEQLSRGLALVKWWLLAIPHYLVVAVFVGGGTWFAWDEDPWRFAGDGGLIGLLVLIAGVVLLFTGRYPQSIFDFVLGLNRWALRVAAYAALMTDSYPPFRLDLGESEPGELRTEPAPPLPSQAAAGAPSAASGWTGGRVVLVVLGSLAALIGAALLAGGGAAVVLDQTQRDSDGFLMTPTEAFSSDGYAVVSESIDVAVAGHDWAADWLVGTVKIRSESPRSVFVGIARASDTASYLGAVRHSVVTDIGEGRPRYAEKAGAAPATPPEDQRVWTASARGSGTQSLTWKPQDGDWNVVLMNTDGSPGVQADLAIGAELDPLIWIGIGLLASGLLVLGGGAVLIAVAARRASAPRGSMVPGS